ncbi:pyruvate dehydrogenase complex dihydrolipoamide acetyltransferase [Adhaeribacter radiodurans]|uniref:Acetyltransferase component of pyruvate dehydrogenase complex n=1 Tax=Adhaeribacter radiodurans TaxID=2745197 RepID=A0A7L7L6W0_9BACT|nr:pyruvate dehydrogenase complex dihydrolipoamide acetyltransferase [Adhaeribacter radiodurans]QMU28538.1 pyruvate dehydrogenase complex dihydrolipoamide acetyltransferase [Adhaeribacter radiodurans]
MAEVIKMPKMSDTMTEGVIASWLKKVGDTVKSGDILAEVETDKATMELESYEDGTLLFVGPKEKDSVPVDGILAIIGKQNEDISGLLSEIQGGGSAPKAAEQPVAPAATPADKPAPAPAAAAPAAPAPSSAPVNASVITMPKMSDTMTEGTIANWLKKVGDKVKSGDILAEVETDKATMELESYEDGTLLYVGVEAGSSVAVDGVIAIIGEEGADYQQLLNGGNGGAAGAQPTPGQNLNQADEQVENAQTDTQINNSTPSGSNPNVNVPGQGLNGQSSQASAANTGGRIFASPLAKKIAEEKGIDLAQVKGSGDNGRIVVKDVESFTPAAAPAAPAAATTAAPAPAAKPQPVAASAPSQDYEEVPVSQMRKVIAKRLSESLFTAPHFYLTMEIDMDKAIETRNALNEVSPIKISFNDLVIKAAAAALRSHPAVNSSWLGDKIRFNKQINIGVAMAVEEGLLVPVVRQADQKSLSQIAGEVKDFSGKAKSKKLQPADWEGNTFTISNLGMFGIEEFTAIINPPDACIMAVGGIKQTPVVKNGQVVPGNVMKVTLSCDHRVVDGAVGSAFLQTFKKLLEDPIRILV